MTPRPFLQQVAVVDVPEPELHTEGAPVDGRPGVRTMILSQGEMVGGQWVNQPPKTMHVRGLPERTELVAGKPQDGVFRAVVLDVGQYVPDLEKGCKVWYLPRLTAFGIAPDLVVDGVKLIDAAQIVAWEPPDETAD